MTAGARRFTVAAVTGAFVAVAIFLVFSITAPGGFFFRTSYNLGGFYDAQARALFHGHWNAGPKAFFIERFNVDGKFYMYFGPWPSFLRMPLLLLTSRFDGRLTHLSLVLAIVTLFIGVGRLLWDIRALTDPRAEPSRRELVAVAGFVALIGVGSALVFLSASGWVYDEAILWGAAWAMWSLHFVISYLRTASLRSLVLASAATTFAILSRESVGAIGALVLGALFLVDLLRTRHREVARNVGRRLAALAGIDNRPGPGRPWSALLAAAVPIGAFVAVNEVRFGTLFSAPWQKQDLGALTPNRQAVLAANGGGLVSWREVPTNLVRYFRPGAFTVSRLFPFIDFGTNTTVIGHAARDPEGLTASVTITATLLLLLAIAGAAVVVVPRLGRRAGLQHMRILRLPVVASAAVFVPSLIFPAAAERYTADLVPFFATAGGVGIYAVARLTRRGGLRRMIVGVVVMLALFNVWTNLALTLNFQRRYQGVTASERGDYVSKQIKWSKWFGITPRADFVDWDPRENTPQPAPARIGTFLSIANCSELRLSNGSEWLELNFRDPQAVCRALGFRSSDSTR